MRITSVKGLCFLSVTGLLAAVTTASIARAESGQKSKLESLMKEVKQIQSDRAAAVKDTGKLATQEKALTGAWELIKSSKKRYEKDVLTHNTDVRQHKQQKSALLSEAGRYAAQVQAHNNNPNRGSANKARLDAWRGRLMATGRTLDAKGKQLNDHMKTLDVRRDAINSTIRSQTRETMSWAKRKKANIARLAELDRRERLVRQKIRSFITDTTLIRDLKRRNRLAQQAKTVDLERAHRILQHIWDGARLNP